MKKETIDLLVAIWYIITICSCVVLFLRLWYKGWYDIAKTEDALMCVRDCMPFPYNQ